MAQRLLTVVVGIEAVALTVRVHELTTPNVARLNQDAVAWIVLTQDVSVVTTLHAMDAVIVSTTRS